MTGRYEELHTRSLSDPEGFWGDAASEIDWIKPWDTVLDSSNPPFYRWFKGGVLNTCLQRRGPPRRGRARRSGGPDLRQPRHQLGPEHHLFRTSRHDRGLRRGAASASASTKGDRVIIYMPMIPAGGRRHARLRPAGRRPFRRVRRLRRRTSWRPGSTTATPKVVVTASCGIEGSKRHPVQAAARRRHRPFATTSPTTFVDPSSGPQATASLVEPRDVDWEDAVTAPPNRPSACRSHATDPLYILYTSGTTGQPKGVVRDNGGHAVALKWTMSNMYDIKPGEVFWAASDIGWVGRPFLYLLTRPLLHGATTIVFEGKPVGTPDAGAFWRVIQQHKVSALFTAPDGVPRDQARGPGRQVDPKDYDLSSLRALFLAGERSDPDTLHWAEDHLGVPVVDHWWQTETGWCIAGNPLGIERFQIKYGSATKALPGWDVRALDISNNEVKRGDIGAISVKLPLPPGTLTTLWNADARFVKSYMTDYPGYYQTGDAGFIDDDGYVYIMARTDDIINVAGHRLSTGAMEEVLSSHKDVAECAVIGVADQLKGQVPLGFLVLKNGVDRDHAEITKEVVQLVRDEIGPVAAFKLAIVVDRLPKTRSGKILRGTMQKIADSESYKLPATIDDPAILSEISEALQGIGYAKPSMA